MAVADREKALEAALAQIEKAHGKGSVMRLGEETRQPVEVIPTGSIALDVAQSGKYIQTEIDRWSAIVKLSGAKLD